METIMEHDESAENERQNSIDEVLSSSENELDLQNETEPENVDTNLFGHNSENRSEKSFAKELSEALANEIQNQQIELEDTTEHEPCDLAETDDQTENLGELQDLTEMLEGPAETPEIQDHTDSEVEDLTSTDTSQDHNISTEELNQFYFHPIGSTDNELPDPEEQQKRLAEAEIGLACPKCLQPFTDTRVPQTLPECQHVCCTSCLMHLSKWDAISNIDCPRCGTTSKLPNGGTATMETNDWLHGFVQQHQKGKLGEHLTDISNDLQGMREDMEKSVETLMQLEKDTKEALKMEEENVDRCVEAVQAEAWVLKAQIRKIGEQRLKHMQEDIAQMQSRAQDISMVHDITKASQENGNIQHIKYDELSSQMDKLLSMTSPATNSMKSPQVARFLRENVTLGRVIKLRNLQLVYEFTDHFKEVHDIVVTPNGLLALCDIEGNAVTIHTKGKQDNNNQPQYTTELSLELNPTNPHPPTGVAATLDGKYIVARQTGIEVYSMAGAYQKTYAMSGISSKTKSPLSKTAPYVYSLTTTEDGKVLAGDINRKVITIHDLSGDIVSIIHTTIKPRCIAPAWEKHLVAITDWESGRLVVQHIGSGSQVLTLDIPDALGVCYDRGSASLLVARSERDPTTGNICVGTGVIEQYNSSGDRTLIVCLAQDLYGACAMEFISSDMLAVADYKAVKIYKVT